MIINREPAEALFYVCGRNGQSYEASPGTCLLLEPDFLVEAKISAVVKFSMKNVQIYQKDTFSGVLLEQLGVARRQVH
ncbi:hypothetical protein EBB07_08430 [Paenibacillaceae bacterium]|nr:hypothetical protein EBB07_08430 [Paenibacillaceae bacterium]